MTLRRADARGGGRRRRRRAALVVLALVVVCLALCGCKVSERLTEVIYDQEAETIDYENESKVLVQDPEAEETTDELPLVETADDEKDDTTEDDPVEDDEDNTDEEADTPDVTSENSVAYTTVSGGTVSAGSGGSSGDSDDEEESGGSDADDASDDEADEGPTDDDETGESPNGEVIGGTDGARSGNDITYYSEVGTYQETPTGIDGVAAVGEAATIVSMLAGDSGALLYTDAEWASRENVQEVLGDRYNDEVQIAWTEDGDGYDLSDEALETMLADEELECVFVISGQKTLTDDQQEALEDAGIVVSYLPDLSSATDILETVQWIGRIFEAGTDQNTTAAERADAYVEFHDDILEAAAKIADTSTDDDDGAPVSSGGTQYYTLYVSDWADDVTYVGTSADLTMAYGIGICTLGYTWSPLSYYLSVAGVQNTSSSPRGSSSSGTALVWQFNTNQLSAAESDFSRGSLVSSYWENSGNTSYGWTYLCSSDFQGVGTTRFPIVITDSQATTEKMQADKDLGQDNDDINTLYELYPSITASSGTVTYTWVGALGTSSFMCYSVGGLTVRQSSGQTASEVAAGTSSAVDYAIVTNPEGLFGESWVEGTVESVLETAWASYLYYSDEYDDSYVAQTIYDFYAEFYGYELSSDEIETILAGAEE